MSIIEIIIFIAVVALLAMIAMALLKRMIKLAFFLVLCGIIGYYLLIGLDYIESWQDILPLFFDSPADVQST